MVWESTMIGVVYNGRMSYGISLISIHEYVCGQEGGSGCGFIAGDWMQPVDYVIENLL